MLDMGGHGWVNIVCNMWIKIRKKQGGEKNMSKAEG